MDPQQVGELWFWLEINDGKNYIRDSMSVIVKDTLGIFTDPRDSHEYKWVKIGQQIWMAENLAYLPDVAPPTEWSGSEASYYVYDYVGDETYTAKSSELYSQYGVLYNFPAAQAACPVGWHLPTDAEWKLLEGFLKTSPNHINESLGSQLKSNEGWKDGGNGKNTSGFNAKPAGWADSSFSGQVSPQLFVSFR